MLFVSLVGTQTYAILNTFLAANQKLRLNRAALLCTSYTESHANSLKPRMEQENTSVDIHIISNALVPVATGMPGRKLSNCRIRYPPKIRLP